VNRHRGRLTAVQRSGAARVCDSGVGEATTKVSGTAGAKKKFGERVGCEGRRSGKM
jgi:hypothetical protein